MRGCASTEKQHSKKGMVIQRNRVMAAVPFNGGVRQRSPIGPHGIWKLKRAHPIAPVFELKQPGETDDENLNHRCCHARCLDGRSASAGRSGGRSFLQEMPMTSSAAVSHSSACCRGAAVNRRRRDGQHTERLWPEYVE